MAEVNKWSVTYTKHLKQKRKVYHDGTLHLLNDKVMLYDECEQLLDSKFMAKDDIVKSGESITFASFLVDIGDPDTNCNSFSTPNPNFERDNKPRERTQVPQRENLRNAFNHRKRNAAGRRPSSICLSPSQKIIREYKKNEALKYSALQSPTSTSPATSSSKEWEALYTTQLTQKAKKYHDGFLRMIICGSQARQIILYDSCKNQLDKRFLTKEEAVTSGESLTFDAHLVDIGDPIGANKDDADMKTQGRSTNATEKSEMLAGCQWQKPFIGSSVSHAKRSIESTPRGDLCSGNPVVIGQRQHDACSSKRVNAGVRCIKSEKIEQKTNHAPHISLRDVNQILSIMRKPTSQDTIVENASKEKFLSRPSELVHSDGDSVCNDAIQADQYQDTSAAEKHNNTNTTNGGQTNSEGNVPQSGCTNVDLAVPQVNGNCSVNKSVREVSMRGSVILKSGAFEPPCKSQSTIGSSVSYGKSIVQDSSKGEGMKGGHFSVSSSEATAHQTSAKLPETNSNSKEKTASKSRPKVLSANLVHKTKRSSADIKSSTNYSQFPSFDLGI